MEILWRVFTHACKDGGQTACSLQLVSRRIFAAALAVRYHSVLVLDTKALNRLARRLVAASPQERQGIRHVFISDQRPLDSSRRLDQSLARQRYCYDEERANADHTILALATVMAACSPTMTSLTLVIHNALTNQVWDILVHYVFPHLVELAVSIPQSNQWGALDEHGKMPRLRTLVVNAEFLTRNKSWFSARQLIRQCTTVEHVILDRALIDQSVLNDISLILHSTSSRKPTLRITVRPRYRSLEEQQISPIPNLVVHAPAPRASICHDWICEWTKVTKDESNWSAVHTQQWRDALDINERPFVRPLAFFIGVLATFAFVRRLVLPVWIAVFLGLAIPAFNHERERLDRTARRWILHK
jgi:hypothetical protein